MSQKSKTRRPVERVVYRGYTVVILTRHPDGEDFISYNNQGTRQFFKNFREAVEFKRKLVEHDLRGEVRQCRLVYEVI